jgi:hypothetical protein
VEQENFDRFAVLEHTVESGRDHPGVIDDQQIAGLEILRQVREPPVFRLPVAPVQDQET